MNGNLDQTEPSANGLHTGAEDVTGHQTSSQRPPGIHPGEVLRNEFLKPLGITAYRLAKDIRMSQSTIAQLVRGKRNITPRTAVRLSRYFGNPAEYWLVLQNGHDLEGLKSALRKELEST